MLSFGPKEAENFWRAIETMRSAFTSQCSFREMVSRQRNLLCGRHHRRRLIVQIDALVLLTIEFADQPTMGHGALCRVVLVDILFPFALVALVVRDLFPTLMLS